MDSTGLMLLGWGAFVFVMGYLIAFVKNRTIARVLAWSLVLFTTWFSVTISTGATPLFRMVAIASLQLVAMKSIVLVETYSGKRGLNFIQWGAFALAWFGMRPALFENFISKPLERVWKFLAGPKTVLFSPFFAFFQLRNSTMLLQKPKTDKKSPRFCLQQKSPNTFLAVNKNPQYE